jgi:hypothetical protein
LPERKLKTDIVHSYQLPKRKIKRSSLPISAAGKEAHLKDLLHPQHLLAAAPKHKDVMLKGVAYHTLASQPCSRRQYLCQYHHETSLLVYPLKLRFQRHDYSAVDTWRTQRHAPE